MNKLIYFILLFPLLAMTEHKPTKHQVTFKITYNSITLEQAAEIEKQIMMNHKTACKVDVDIKDIQSGGTAWQQVVDIDDGEVLYWDGDTYLRSDGDTIRWIGMTNDGSQAIPLTDTVWDGSGEIEWLGIINADTLWELEAR